jgi:hypothetical protein
MEFAYDDGGLGKEGDVAPYVMISSQERLRVATAIK